jgi:hypothetical protein
VNRTFCDICNKEIRRDDRSGSVCIKADAPIAPGGRRYGETVLDKDEVCYNCITAVLQAIDTLEPPARNAQ